MPKAVSKAYYRDASLLTSIGLKVRELRLERNLSQESLAIECGVPSSQINRIELGKVNFTVSYLSKLAKALQVNLKDLLP